jgi:hypothetical protein
MGIYKFQLVSLSSLSACTQAKKPKKSTSVSSMTDVGHININNLTYDQFINIVESGAVEHLVTSPWTSLAEPSFLSSEPFVLATPIVQVRRLEVDYDPNIHYPPNFSKHLFGGIPDDSTLTAHFKAWNELYRLPQFKVIPKYIHKSGFYRNEGPTFDMHCRREECQKDLT